jgi:DNA polymerase elongation subunit (family B)
MKNISKTILFLDIETVPQFSSYKDLPEQVRQFWDKKASYLDRKSELTTDQLYERAGIYAEFGKVICISVAYLHESETEYIVRIKSFIGTDEKKLLTNFAALLRQNSVFSSLCAHNGKEFDFPYLCRRMIIHDIPLPSQLDISSKKPWEIPHKDTMEMWKFGDYKHYTSLDLMAHIFNIPTPKDDMNGTDVYHVYYHENNIERIAEYCRKDVITLLRVYYKLHGVYLNDKPLRVESVDN